MKKILTIAAGIALTFGFSASAQILYKVEKQGSDKVSYILGTHHFAPLSVVDSIDELPGIIAGVDKVYGELDMSEMTKPATLMLMQQKMMAPADSTLATLLTPEQKTKLAEVWNEYTGVPQQLDMLVASVKPAVISTALAAAMASKTLPDFNPNEGIDMTMQTRAAEAQKPVAGLETIDFQIDMLYNRPISEQLESLLKTVEEADEENAKAIALADAYKAHDINRLYDLLVKAEEENPDSMERMIYSRNDNWVTTLGSELPTTSALIVVGAGHLPGDRGILEGLKKAGFTVTPVK